MAAQKGHDWVQMNYASTAVFNYWKLSIAGKRPESKAEFQRISSFQSEISSMRYGGMHQDQEPKRASGFNKTRNASRKCIVYT